MTQDLFSQWLNRLDRYIEKKQERKILLPVDNCYAHEKKQNAADLQNVCVDILSPKNNSKEQLLEVRGEGHYVGEGTA